jgi:hypothetical protein
MLIPAEGFPADIDLAELSYCLIIEFEPSIILFYQRVVMSTLGGSGMDDDSFQIVRSWLVARTEISVKIENLLKY